MVEARCLRSQRRIVWLQQLLQREARGQCVTASTQLFVTYSETTAAATDHLVDRAAAAAVK